MLMNYLNVLRTSALRVSSLPLVPAINSTFKRYRKPSPCGDLCLYPPDQKPCFDIKNVVVERGNQCHGKLIRAFLYDHYWPREPSVVGLWMSLDAPYLRTLTNKYAYSGDRLLAMETDPRTGERKVVGVICASKIFPWEPDELEDWAHATPAVPERHRMYFTAHCYRSPKLFKKYNVDYLYEIEVLVTAAEVTGHGVGKLLLKTALDHALELRHKLIQVISVSAYSSKICESCGMKKEWSMDYVDFVNDAGVKVFFPRRPHHTVTIYITRLVDTPYKCF